MKRVILTQLRAAPGSVQPAGTEMELDDDEADRRIARGQARAVETAVVKPPADAQQPPAPEKMTKRPREKRG